MRFKVVVTKVEVAERWVRATDEESAAQKVKDELTTPWAYAGKWETKSREVEVVDSEREASRAQQQRPDAGRPKLLNLRDAATELGVSYSALYQMTKRGDIEYTQVGSRKFVSRESLAAFIESNTHR